MPSRSLPLDLLRTLAIFLVFTNHFHQFANDLWFGRLGDFGWVGVDLFFVLSGFLISSQIFKEIKNTKTFSIKTFYLRRGFRIWPAYFFVLAVYVFVPAFIERNRLAPLWKYFSFTLNFGLDYSVEGAFSHAWSLCVEEQFYVFLPPLLLLLVPRINLKKGILLFIGILLWGIGIRAHEWRHWISDLYATHPRIMYRTFYRMIYYPTYCRLDSLATGVAIAAFVQFCSNRWAQIEKFGNAFLVGAIAILTLSYFISQDEYALLSASISYSLNAIAFGSLLLAALSPVGALAKFKGKWATVGANIAFSFYLVHKPIIHLCKGWANDLGLDPGSILYVPLILLIGLAGASIVYFLIEKPFLKWRDQILHERSLHFK